jgi:hypothetical protein
VRHDSAHTVRLLFHRVLREVHESHRTVLCGSINNLEGPERVFEGRSVMAEGWNELPWAAE